MLLFVARDDDKCGNDSHNCDRYITDHHDHSDALFSKISEILQEPEDRYPEDKYSRYIQYHGELGFAQSV